MKKTSSNLALSAAVIASTLALATPHLAYAEQQTKLQFEIKGQALHNALINIGVQYDTVIIAPYALTKDKKSPNVSGVLTVTQALEAVLADSGLTFQLTESGGYLIKAVTKSTQDSRSITKLEHIVVKGEKVERKLIDATSSVSVIDAEQLNNLQFLSFSNALSNIANVVVVSGQSPDIRGVSGNGSAGGFNGVSGGAKPRVTTLVDGVAEPFVADLTGDSGLWDLAQMEVFRGPQSTVTGRNSMAGIVFIKTQDPSFDWTAAARVGYRNLERHIDTAGVVSGPIIDDELAFRLSVQRVDGQHFDNEISFADNPPDFDLDGLDTQRLRAKVLWAPQSVPGLSALFTISDLSEEGNTGRRYYAVDNPWDFIPVIERNISTDNTTSSIDIDYAINDSMSADLLISTTSYDYGFTSYEENPAAQQIFAITEDNWFMDGRLNFGLNSASYDGYLGLSHFSREQDFNSKSGFRYLGDDETDSTALYGEFSFSLNDNWSLIAGGRIEREQQIRNFSRFNRDNTVDSANLDESKTISLPKLVLQYHISDDTTAALSARKGYNAGGGAFWWPTGEYYYFDAESVVTYEASVRSNFANGKGYINSNLFFNQYDDYQGTDVERRIANIKDVESRGLELEVSYHLTADLIVNTGLGLLKTEINDASESYVNVNGNELSSAPKITANIGVNYWFNDQLNLAFSTRYVDEYYGDFTNSEEGIAGNYAISRINLNYELDNWKVSAFVNNIFDKQALTLRLPVSGRLPQGSAGIEDPRNIGLAVTYIY